MKKQWLYLLVLGILMLCGCNNQSASEHLKSVSLTCDKEELLVDETATITYSITPAEIPLEQDCFYSNGGTITLQEDHLSFQSDVPGTYEIYCSKDDVQSNTITIVVAEKAVTIPDEQDSSASPLISDGTPHNAPMSVDWLLENVDSYVDTKTQVWVQGDLPQTKVLDEYGELRGILYNDDHSRFIILQGEIPIGNCHAAIVGTLTANEKGQYILLVDSVKAFS